MLTNKMKKIGVKGFSLVELMVVVAIIGILAAVAIPNFQRFQRKARQSESRALLSGARTALEAFTAEWDTYTSDLVLAGFVIKGQLDTHIDATSADFAATPIYEGITPETVANHGTQIPAVRATGGAVVGARACAPDDDAAMTRTTYTMGSCSDIGGAAADHWQMLSTTGLTNTQDGVL